jgi:ATP-dependent Clp protease protease subunit
MTKKMKNSRLAWEFRSQENNPKIGELLIYDIISSDGDWWATPEDVTPKNFKRELDALGDVDELHIYINSGGGDVFAAQAIYSMLERHRSQKITHVDGLAASAASLLFQAGDRRLMYLNTMQMVHKPWNIEIGNADDFRKMADTLDQVEKSISAIYQVKTGKSEEEIAELFRAETWMTAEEAVEMGFADEVEESKQVAACLNGSILTMNGKDFDVSGFKNVSKLNLPTLEKPAEKPKNEPEKPKNQDENQTDNGLISSYQAKIEANKNILGGKK